jgi:hypothetical protein
MTIVNLIRKYISKTTKNAKGLLQTALNDHFPQFTFQTFNKTLQLLQTLIA